MTGKKPCKKDTRHTKPFRSSKGTNGKKRHRIKRPRFRGRESPCNAVRARRKPKSDRRCFFSNTVMAVVTDSNRIPCFIYSVDNFSNRIFETLCNCKKGHPPRTIFAKQKSTESKKRYASSSSPYAITTRRSFSDPTE